MTFRCRVRGCFKGLATGDAIGKQTETLAHALVRQWYPGGIAGFHGPPGAVIPRYIGKRYQWRIGETTDDTEQTLAVARAILREGAVSHTGVGAELLRCRKSLHPDVSLWRFAERGDPSAVARDGDGCGAAMRSAPVGVFYRTRELDKLVGAATECALPTHGGPMAIAAAAAVAAAVSAAVEGRSAADALSLAIRASRAAPPCEMADCIEATHASLASRQTLDADALAGRHFPGSPRTIVPLAISLAVVTGSAREAILLAANIGGDADSVASMAGAIAGALHPDTVDEEWWNVVSAINREPILEIATALAEAAAVES